MKKKIIFVWEEFARSWVFNVLLVIGTVICIMMMGVSLFAQNENKVNSAFYNGSVANTSYVEFDAMGLTVGELKETLSSDLGDLAATYEFYAEEPRETVKVITPAAIRNMPKLGVNFSGELPDGYREAVVPVGMNKRFVKGEFYDIVKEDGGAIRVKVIGYLDESDYYYSFRGYGVLSRGEQNIVICDEVTDDAKVFAGFFFNGNSPDHYRAYGFNAKYGKDLYLENTFNRILVYLSVIIILILLTAIFCNYMLNLDKLKKRHAVQYLCGAEHKTLVTSEIIKMSFLFVVSSIIGIIVTAVLGSLGAAITPVIDFAHLAYGILTVLGVYLITVGAGVAALYRLKPLTAIKDEVNE